MKKILKFLGKEIALFIVGALIYMGIEIIFRGFTHWTMGVVGGLCFIIIGLLNEGYNWEMPFWKQCLIGACVITALEFTAGVILNMILGLHIWDYSTMPLNIFGQICLPFSLAWMGLSGVAIILDDYIRYWFFNEEKPHYKWI